MPQMMPINWILSLIFTIMVFMIFIMKNYFIFDYKMNQMNKNMMKTKKNFFSWKW